MRYGDTKKKRIKWNIPSETVKKIFLRLAVERRYDYVKRAVSRKEVPCRRCPRVRPLGNLVLTFLTRMVSRFREIWGSQNGYVLITRHIISWLPLERIDRGYFFENSMLIALNVLGGRVGEMYVPVRYDGEMSSLRIFRIIPKYVIRLSGVE